MDGNETAGNGHVIGPTGPNGSYQAGDKILYGLVPVMIDQEGADKLNHSRDERQRRATATELTRPGFQLVSVCRKCDLRYEHDLVWRPYNAECSDWHGKTEHVDRQCLRCGFVWSESLDKERHDEPFE